MKKKKQKILKNRILENKIKIEISLKVEGLLKPERIDAYCTKKLPGITRSKLKTGLMFLNVNSFQAKLSKRITNGDIILLKWEDPIPEYPEPENIPLNILYEDENIIAVNKRAGMVTHPAAGRWKGTLVNALNYYRLFTSPYKDEFSNVLKKIQKTYNENILKYNETLFRQGIVHRLDKDTSGLIITARNIKTETFLKKEFKERKVKKYYIALLDGVPKEKKGRIKTSIFRAKNKKKFSTSKDLSKGKIALSAYKVLRSNGKYALAIFRIFTGRTHQIRLHAKFLGCPVLGDSMYGKKNKELSNERLMLHAYKVILKFEEDRKAKTFKAALPKNFKTVLKKIKI